MILRSFSVLLIALSASVAGAECSRTDIDYYLSKGFSHEQITALCSAGSSAQPEYRPYESRNEAEEQRISEAKEREEDVLTMKTSIKGWDIDLTAERLAYTRKFCIAAGKTKEVEGRIRICPEVSYQVFFKGLKIGGHERKYFVVGQREIEVIGQVKRKLLHDLKEYPSDLRRELLASYKSRTSKAGTVIPIRQDVPLSRVMDILREYSH